MAIDGPGDTERRGHHGVFAVMRPQPRRIPQRPVPPGTLVRPSAQERSMPLCQHGSNVVSHPLERDKRSRGSPSDVAANRWEGFGPEGCLEVEAYSKPWCGGASSSNPRERVERAVRRRGKTVNNGVRSRGPSRTWNTRDAEPTPRAARLSHGGCWSAVCGGLWRRRSTEGSVGPDPPRLAARVLPGGPGPPQQQCSVLTGGSGSYLGRHHSFL